MLLAGMLLAGVLTPGAARAQESATRWAPSPRAAALLAPVPVTGPVTLSFQDPDESPMAGMTGSGFFLGVIGMLAGTTMGSATAGRNCTKDCRRDRGAGGAMVGGALLIPLGVHIANPSPGSLLAASAASSLLGAAVWLFVGALPSQPMPLAPFLAAPLQLQAAIFVEEWRR
ncbi:MAG: hypothetical protein WEA24_02895 [Gemmatimonadota bacterium]